jgi:uncharacterized protein YecE (DUF72 family)
VRAQDARALLELRNAIIELSNARAPFIHAFVHVGSALLKLRHAQTHDGSALLKVRDALLGIRGTILEVRSSPLGPTHARSLSIRAFLGFSSACIELTAAFLELGNTNVNENVVAHPRGPSPQAVAQRGDESAIHVPLAPMRVLVGTSGYSYKEWKPAFYPDDLPARAFLRFYAERLSTVEINNTFYRMPTGKLVTGWASEVPETFTFALKAPQRITHIARLKDAGEATAAFLRVAGELGPRLGPLLFQLPPFMRKDTERLVSFLEATSALPQRPRIAMEFRHPSWFDEEVFAALRAHGAALCIAEGEALAAPLVATADWGYLRLRRESYPSGLITEWAKKIRSQPWNDAFVYLKHDDGDAPGVAKRLIDALDLTNG